MYIKPLKRSKFTGGVLLGGHTSKKPAALKGARSGRPKKVSLPKVSIQSKPDA